MSNSRHLCHLGPMLMALATISLLGCSSMKASRECADIPLTVGWYIAGDNVRVTLVNWTRDHIILEIPDLGSEGLAWSFENRRESDEESYYGCRSGGAVGVWFNHYIVLEAMRRGCVSPDSTYTYTIPVKEIGLDLLTGGRPTLEIAVRCCPLSQLTGLQTIGDWKALMRRNEHYYTGERVGQSWPYPSSTNSTPK